MNTTIETINKEEMLEDYKKIESIEDNMKEVFKNIDESGLNKLKTIIENSGILEMDSEFDIDNNVLNLFTQKSKTTVQTSSVKSTDLSINEFVSDSYWKDIKYWTKVFVKNYADYRKFVIDTTKYIYNNITKKIHDFEIKTLNFISELTSLLSSYGPTGNEYLDGLQAGLEFVSRGTYAAAEVLDKIIYPQLDKVYNSLDISDEYIISWLYKAICEKENIFQVLALQEKAHKVFKDKPWYKKLISGSIIQKALYEHIAWTKREIKQATEFYNKAILYAKSKEYERNFGGY